MATGLMSMAKTLRGQTSVDVADLPALIAGARDAMQARGKADLGGKTVLDSLDAEITAGKYGNIDRMLVIRRGRIVMNKWYPRDYDTIYGDSSRASSSLNNSHDPTGPFN